MNDQEYSRKFATMLTNAPWFRDIAASAQAIIYSSKLSNEENLAAANAHEFSGSDKPGVHLHTNGKWVHFVAYFQRKNRYLVQFDPKNLTDAMRFADAFTSHFAKYRSKKKLVWNFSKERGHEDAHDPAALPVLLAMEAVLKEQGFLKDFARRKQSAQDMLNTRLGNLEARLNLIEAGVSAIQVRLAVLDEINFKLAFVNSALPQAGPFVSYDAAQPGTDKTARAIVIKPLDVEDGSVV